MTAMRITTPARALLPVLQARNNGLPLPVARCCPNGVAPKEKDGLLLPGARRPRPRSCEEHGALVSSLSRLSSGETQLRIVVVGNYQIGPMRRIPYRAKTLPLLPRRSCFAPITCLQRRRSWHMLWYMVEAPGTAPGSDGYITRGVYRHSRQCNITDTPHIPHLPPPHKSPPNFFSNFFNFFSPAVVFPPPRGHFPPFLPLIRPFPSGISGAFPRHSRHRIA